MKINRRRVMQNAWKLAKEMARQAACEFPDECGSAKDYLSIAMKLSWEIETSEITRDVMDRTPGMQKFRLFISLDEIESKRDYEAFQVISILFLAMTGDWRRLEKSRNRYFGNMERKL